MKAIGCLVFLLLLHGCSTGPSRKEAVQQPPLPPKHTGFFVSAPIAEFSSTQIPCLRVNIEDQQLLLKLDLGFRGDLSLEANSLSSIRSKVFLGEKDMYGMRGKKYRENVYRIPKVEIGLMTFSPLHVLEQDPMFMPDARLIQDGQDAPTGGVGTLGWQLFVNTNLLIDIQQSRIAFCDSLDELHRAGYITESCVKVPLLLERGLVELEAEGPDGMMRCVLDTGSTWNIINAEIDKEVPLEIAVWEEQNSLELPFLKLGGRDQGPLPFHRMPIRLPIHVEAVLGMEFFKKHVVFLDFKNGCAYVWPNEEPLLCRPPLKHRRCATQS
ncbi:MAG: hypothetical protein KGR16_00450 [Verrucomicrobia bacterium]|nr:hypothetical protein [Verrucomicrobiota bacterium]MDE3046829.1 hypothetical protein [Verrucomicrobiota bacterium]